MNPLTNSQIETLKTPAQKSAERGGLGEVQTSVTLRSGYQLIGHRKGCAEIRRDHTVVYAGTWAECEQWAQNKGVWHAA